MDDFLSDFKSMIINLIMVFSPIIYFFILMNFFEKALLYNNLIEALSITIISQFGVIGIMLFYEVCISEIKRLKSSNKNILTFLLFIPLIFIIWIIPIFILSTYAYSIFYYIETSVIWIIIYHFVLLQAILSSIKFYKTHTKQLLKIFVEE